MALNSCLYKMFTTYPTIFGRTSGAAGWLNAIYTGIIALLLLAFTLRLFPKLYKKIKGRPSEALLRFAVAIYWVCASAYALRIFIQTLKIVSYTNAPDSYTAILFLLGAAVTACCGARAVYRLHSLLAGFAAVSIAAIAILGFKYSEPSLLAPIMGNGARAVFINGLSSLFLYTDIFFLPILFPSCRTEVNTKKTVLTACLTAVLLNTLIMLAVCMTHSPEAYKYSVIPIYPLTKMAYFGRFWSRLDALYLAAFMTSAMLYLSLALHMVYICVGSRAAVGGKITAAVLLCLISCTWLTGCFDSREVEESAYVIALGIDKKGNENNMYQYTFQVSNPLERGTKANINDEKSDKSPSENKGVTNIGISAHDFYSALDGIRGQLGKEPELTHLKLMVFSKELAEEGLSEHTTLLYKERETRPGIKLCMANSAEGFLNGVSPRLEQSTARYYELLFNEKNVPYAPITELWRFVSDNGDLGADAVLPVANGEELTGFGVFHYGKLTALGDAHDAVLYKLLTGRCKNITVNTGTSAFSVSSLKKPRIKTDTKKKRIVIYNSLNASLIYGNSSDSSSLMDWVNVNTNEFLSKYASSETDILGLGRKLKKTAVSNSQILTQKDDFNLKNYTLCVKNHINFHKNVKNIQK